MGDLAKALNTPHPFEFEGMAFKLTPPANKTFTEFQRWLEFDAVQTVRRMRARLADDEYREMLAGASRDVTAKRYAIGKPAYREAVASPEGVAELIRLMLLPCHPQADAELVRRMLEDEDTAQALAGLVGQIMPPDKDDGAGDPKAPAAGRPGPP